jgi:hypothetical protein
MGINIIREAWLSSPCLKEIPMIMWSLILLFSVMNKGYKCSIFNSIHVNQRVVVICSVRLRIHIPTAAYEVYTKS